MKNSFKLAGLGLATTMALAMQSPAQAYTFSNFNPDPSEPYTASGFFDIDDTLGSIPGEVEFATELVDFEINIFENGILDSTINPSNSVRNGNTLTGVSVSPTTVDFSTANGGSFFRDFNSANGFSFYIDAGEFSGTPLSQLLTNSGSFEQGTTNNLTALQEPQAVPFGVSTDLSILILGGLYGASRLRKTIAARKRMSNQEA